jgi:hypothetical protein
MREGTTDPDLYSLQLDRREGVHSKDYDGEEQGVEV